MKKKKKKKRKSDPDLKSPYGAGVERPKVHYKRRIGTDAFGVRVDL